MKKSQWQGERAKENSQKTRLMEKWWHTKETTDTVYVRTVPHPTPKEHKVTQYLRTIRSLKQKRSIWGKVGGYFQPPPGKKHTNPAIILACFSSSWRKKIPLHCTEASIFWFHKLNSEHITISPSCNAKTLWVSRVVFTFMPSTGSLWAGRAALLWERLPQLEHIYSSPLSPQLMSHYCFPSPSYRAPSRWDSPGGLWCSHHKICLIFHCALLSCSSHRI